MKPILRRQKDFAILMTGIFLVGCFVPAHAQSDRSDQPLENDRSFLGMGNQESAPLERTMMPVPVRENVPASPDASLIEELDLKDVDISDLLKLLSQKSGLNIVIGSSVTGKVTLYLKNVTAIDVLDIMAKTNDLAYVREARLIHVMTGADYEKTYGRRFFKNSKTVMQRLNYISIAEVVPMLERMKSPAGIVLADARSGTVSLNDLPENILDMVAFIREIDVPRLTKVFDLIYAKAEDLSERINLILTPTVGSMRFDKRTNKISVTDIPDKIREIEQMIMAFDVKEQQVAIEAKIVQVILSDQFQMGVNWEAVLQKSHDFRMLGNFDVLGATQKRGQMSIGNLDNDNYKAMIQALETFGKTENLSNPHIMVINNQEAKILVGSTEPYVTSTTTTPASGPVTTAETVNFIEVGVKLYVTPTVHADGFVTLKIKPEVSSVTRNVTTSNNNTIPVVETSEAETTVLVKDGVTIIIGGLIKDEKINTDSRVPVLGSLPLIGGAFRNRDHLTRKTELVIFLTPRIVSGNALVEQKSVKQTADSLR